MSEKKWTVENMPDQEGKVVIITGGNTGLGYESVKVFTEKGASVILACRSIEKGEKAKKSIMMNHPRGTIQVLRLDLMDLDSIRKFSDYVNKNLPKIDVLLNNAGIMTTPYFETKDGFEGQLGTNHLGHFALTGMLIDLISRTPNSRVVNVSSIAHKNGKIHFDNLMFRDGKDYTPMKSYGQSKLANLLFTFELQRYFDKNGSSSIALAAHPGASLTELSRHIDGKFWFKILGPLIKAMSQSAAMGALPLLRASVAGDMKGSEYFGPDGFGEIKGYPVQVKANKNATDEDLAKKLWTKSEELTGVKY